MANPELGTKQICPSCQTKFYDLTRRPAHCPKCGADFDPEEAVRSRRVRARGATPDYDAEDAPPKPAPDEDAEEGFEEADATPEIDQGVEDAPVVADEEEVVGPAEPEDTGMREFQEEDEAVEEEEEEEADAPFLPEEDEDGFPDDDLNPAEKGARDA